MSENKMLAEMHREIDLELRRATNNALLNPLPHFKEMLEYQLGLDNGEGSSQAQGKRLRPLILLLSVHAAGGHWNRHVASAAAVELLHNFSLIHDDIQDKSLLRRGRPTVWVKWGIAQAINAGDAMLGLAQLEILADLVGQKGADVVSISKRLNETLVELTRGQYLDLSYEALNQIPIRDYQWMVEGKTGALLSACMEMGAKLGGANAEQCSSMAEAGRSIGRAFQIQDDWLGIWGSEETTGKSARSDLLERKKTYPVVLGMLEGGEFAREWEETERIEPEKADRLAMLLTMDGIKKETEKAFRIEYSSGIETLKKVDFDESLKQPLIALVESILIRMK